MSTLFDRDLALQVRSLGKVFGRGGADAVPGTGPDTGTSVSPLTGAVVAAWGVDFEVERGEAVGIIGESGSGKTTVLRCVAGDEVPTSGSVLLHAGGPTVDVVALTPSERRALRVGRLSIVHQDPSIGLDLHLSAGVPTWRSGSWPPAGGTTARSAGASASCSTASRSRRAAWTTGSVRSRAACVSACSSPRRSPTIRRWCCSTSRPPDSTRRSRPRCST